MTSLETMERAAVTGNAVTTEGLTRRFGRVIALNGVNFTVPTGAVLGLLGPNGSGKTTLLSILAGFITPTEGSFCLLGESSHRLALARTGALISRPLLWPHLSCRDNLRAVQGLQTGQPDRDEVERLLGLVGLAGPAAERKFGQCSTGMRQRLGIAAALLGDPELLLLDEPTNGLDPEGMFEVRELIRQLGQAPGRSIIMSSHLLNEVERTCDYYAIIHRGSLVAQGRIGDAPADSATATSEAAPTDAPATRIATTDNPAARRHLQARGWAVSAPAAGAGGDSTAPPDDAGDGTALTVATAPGEEWKLARDLAEIGVFPTTMYPAARRPAHRRAPAGTLEATYLAAVGPPPEN